MNLLIQLKINIKMQQLQMESQMNQCYHDQEMKLRTNEHDEKKTILNANHQQKMEKMKGDSQQNQFTHEKGMKTIESSANEKIEVTKNNHENK